MNIGNVSSSAPSGVSPQILQQLGIEGPVTNQVFVANVSFFFHVSYAHLSLVYSDGRESAAEACP